MTEHQIIAAVIIGILSVARTARLLVHDAYPPVVWFRMKWEAKWGREGWGKLIFCHYCATPWMAIGMALWWWISGGNEWWWVINGVWGLSYVAAILVSWDEPPA